MGQDAHAVIVGAGPAGAVSALLLARSGLDVLVVDRARFPRPKPCGDCLSAAATQLLDRHGLLDPVLRAGAATITRWDIVAPDGTAASGRFPDRPALALERRLLDALLLDAATAAGARFRQARVTGLRRDTAGRVRGVTTRTGETFTAPLVVGADGLRSVVARALDAIRRPPRLRKVSLTAHVPLARVSSDRRPFRHGEMHLFDGGCVGFAPAGPHRANLTLVVGERHTDDLRRMGADAFFRAWVRRPSRLRHRFHELEPGPLLASGPFDWPGRSAVTPGVALVGDAAGYYDPFTGQGIYQAMAGAELLARALAEPLGRGTDAVDRALADYAAARARLTRPARRVQRVVEAVVSRPWLADRVLGRLAEAGAAMDRLIEVTGDLRPPGSLLSPGVVSSFMFPPDPEIR